MIRAKNKLCNTSVNGFRNIPTSKTSDKVIKINSQGLFFSTLTSHEDDVFLLQFLRTRKYNMDKVFRNFEGYVLSQKKYAKWFDLKVDKDGFMAQARK